MAQLFIANGQTNETLTHIRYQNVISNSHKKSLEDGSETFEFTTHADKGFSPHLEGRNRIIIPGEDEEFLEFIIMEIQEDRIERQLEVHAYASYAELSTAKVITAHTTPALSAVEHGGVALNGTDWRIGIVESDGLRTIQFENRTHPYGYLKRLASVFDLELSFRIEHDNGKITGRYADLLERVGEWRGRRVEFGKDLLGLRRVENTEEIVTALNVIGPADENGDRLEIVVEDEEAFQRWSRNGKHIIKDYEPQFALEENATEERLVELGEQELAKRVKAIVTYEGTIADLEKVPGLEHKKFRFGDTIQIKDTSYEPALYLDARIFFQDRDIKDQAEKQVRLGDFTEYTQEEVDAIWKSLEQQIKNKIGMTDLTEVTYTKPEIDNKDERGNDAADKIESDVGWTEVIETTTGAQDKADQAETESNNYTDLKEQAIRQDLADKAGLEYVDGQLALKADGDIVQTIDNTVNNLQGVTDGLLSDVADHATELQEQGGKITTVETDLDTVEGSLDIALTDLSTLDGVVESQGTQINTNTTAISLKAEQSSVDGLQDEFDSLQVGGRNLIPNSTFKNDFEKWGRVEGNITVQTDTYRGLTVARSFDNDSSKGTRVRTDYIEISPGKDYTLSFYGKEVDNNGYSVLNRIYQYDESFNIINEGEVNIENFPTNNEWVKVEKTFATLENAKYVEITLGYYWSKPQGEFYFTSPMLEKGNKATDWTPAPEDIEADITEVDTRVTNLNSEVEVIAGQVELKAERSELETVEGDVSTLSNEVGNLTVAYDNINASVSDLETVTDGHNTDISDLNAELDVQAGQISTKVDAAYVSGAIGDIEIGGRNLLSNTEFRGEIGYIMPVGWYLSTQNLTPTISEIITSPWGDDSVQAYHIKVDNARAFLVNEQMISVKDENYITISVKTDSNNLEVWYEFYDESGVRIDYSTSTKFKEARRSFMTIEVPSDAIHFRLWRIGMGVGSTRTGEVRFEGVQIEYGKKATDWHPSPEDTQAEIDSVFTYAESEITQLAGRVDTKAEVSVVDGLETRTTTAEQSINALEGEITSKVESSTFNSLEGRVDTAESTISQQANQIQSKIDDGDARSIFTQEANSFTFDADQVNFTGHVFGQDATFTGTIEGSEIIAPDIKSSESSQDFLWFNDAADFFGVGSIGAQENQSSGIRSHFLAGGGFYALHNGIGAVMFADSDGVHWHSMDMYGNTYSTLGISLLDSDTGRADMEINATGNVFVGAPLYSEGNSVETIVSEGSNSNGSWIRYSSGKQEVWCAPVIASATNASGSIYRSDAFDVNYPVDFDTNYDIAVSANVSSIGRWANANNPFGASSCSIIQYSTVSSSSRYSVYVYAVGRWR